jgi:arylsulfatase A-like enzyme
MIRSDPSRLSAIAAPVGVATLAGGAVGLLDAVIAILGGRAESPGSLMVYAVSLGAAVALGALIPLLLSMAGLGCPRSDGGRIGATVGFFLLAPPAVVLARGLYKRIPWTAGDVLLGLAGLLGLAAGVALLALAGSRLSEGTGRRLARFFSRWALPSLLILAPVGVRLLSAIGAPGGARGVEGRPNLLLLTVDTLRADRIGCWGDPAARTPHLDRVARRSYVHSNCIAPSPWTLPSLASVLTGAYPGQHLILQEISRLSPSVSTIAEVCRGEGLRTAAFVSNPWLATGNLAQGFQTFDVAERLEVFHEVRATRLYATLMKAVLRLRKLDAAERISRRGIAWIERGNGSWFLWLHYFDPHLPNWPPRPYDRLFGPPPRHVGSSLTVDEIRAGAFGGGDAGRSEIASLYEGEIAYTDRCIGSVIQHLERIDRLGTTVIVFTADHGEELWDHRDYGHGHAMFDEVVRVPLFVHPPGGVSARPVPGIVPLVDLAPTAIAAARIVAPESVASFFGKNLLGPLAGKPATYGEAILYGTEQKFLRTERWKLILSLGEEAAGKLQLYDVLSDPAESKDLADARPQVTDSLATELASWMKEVGSAGSIPLRDLEDLDPAVLQQLKALGYID